MIKKIKYSRGFIKECEECSGYIIFDYPLNIYPPEIKETIVKGWLPCPHCFLHKESNLEKLDKKEWRKLHSAITTDWYTPIHIVKERLDLYKRQHYFLKKAVTILLLEAHQLFDKLGMDEATRRAYWLLKYAEQEDICEEYNKKPTRIRKDNKDTINYGNKDGRASIRYPKKGRKTAWKRFYKLFPYLKK